MAAIALEEALAIVVAAAEAALATAVVETRGTTIWEASGFVLAEPVRADSPMPPFDKAQVAGFAVRAEDVGAAGETTLKVVGQVAAGEEAACTVGAGEAVAVMTGAPVPRGADAIVTMRDGVQLGGEVRVKGPVEPGQLIAKRGSEVPEGTVVVEAGRIIESLTAGVLASFGAEQVRVYRRPRMTVVATGSELVGIEDTPGPAQIRDSNRKTLMAMGEAEWCRVVDGGIVADDRHALATSIREGLQGDVLILSGGVSEGTHDFVRACLEAEGVTIAFHRVTMTPGRQVLFGRIGNTLVFGLPGNPVSSYVAAMLLVVPALRILGRRPDWRTWYLKMPLRERGLPAVGARTTLFPGELVRLPGDELGVRPRAWQGSADHVAFARASVLIQRDAEAGAVAPGDEVRVLMPRSLADW